MNQRVCSVREIIAPELSADAYRQLSGRALLAVAHWRKRHPDFYQELLGNGTLITRANEAAAQAETSMRDLTAQGVSHEDAWAVSGRNCIFRVPSMGEAGR